MSKFVEMEIRRVLKLLLRAAVGQFLFLTRAHLYHFNAKHKQMTRAYILLSFPCFGCRKSIDRSVLSEYKVLFIFVGIHGDSKQYFSIKKS